MRIEIEAIMILMMFSTAFGVTYHTVDYVGSTGRQLGDFNLGNVTTSDVITLTLSYTNMSN